MCGVARGWTGVYGIVRSCKRCVELPRTISRHLLAWHLARISASPQAIEMPRPRERPTLLWEGEGYGSGLGVGVRLGLRVRVRARERVWVRARARGQRGESGGHGQGGMRVKLRVSMRDSRGARRWFERAGALEDPRVGCAVDLLPLRPQLFERLDHRHHLGSRWQRW